MEEKLEHAATYEELANIAISTLKNIHDNGNQIVRISGPITTGGFNDPIRNLIHFEFAEKKAKEKGLTILDLTIYEKYLSRISKASGIVGYDTAMLEIFYGKIFESGLLSKTLFMPGWEDSTGCRWERDMAEKHGLKIEEYPEEWLKESPAYKS